MRATELSGATTFLTHARHTGNARLSTNSAACTFATIGAESPFEAGGFTAPGAHAVAGAFAGRARGLRCTAPSRLSARRHSTRAATLLNGGRTAAPRGLTARGPARVTRESAIGVVQIRRTALDFRVLAGGFRCGAASVLLLFTLRLLSGVLALRLLRQYRTKAEGQERRGERGQAKSVHAELLEVGARARTKVKHG